MKTDNFGQIALYVILPIILILGTKILAMIFKAWMLANLVP